MSDAKQPDAEAQDANAEQSSAEPSDAEGQDTDAEQSEDPSLDLDETALAKSSRLKAVIIGLVVVVVLGGGGAGLWALGVFNTEKAHEVTVSLPGPPVYYEMPRITVDLKPSGNRARPFIRVLMQAELEGESARQAFIDNEAKILDAMQAHLRQITAQELQGELGTEQLREDFTTIINRIITPERAITVLYKEILIR